MAKISSYVLMLVVAAAVVAAVLHFGASLPAVTSAGDGAPAAAAGEGSMFASLAADFRTPLSTLLLQLLMVVGVCRAFGSVFGRLGLTTVVGEMTAGIVLGPSLLGRVWPEASAFVFPAGSLATLALLSQIAVCIYMFKVGLDVNVRLLRGKAQSAVVVSHASIVVPFSFGVTLAYFLYDALAGERAPFAAFALFMGISMSITAFPVLARILAERGLTRTPLGATAITCAAVDDITAWTALGFVVATAQSTTLAGALPTLVLALVFVAVMVLGVRLVLRRRLGARIEINRGEPTRETVAVVACVGLAAAFCTEAIGIHALFGAFLAGVVMPDSETFRRHLSTAIEKLSFVLLPLFFAFTGLRTQIGLLGDAQAWLVCLLIVAVAIVGKLGASAVAARLTGSSWRDALQLGALLNARGLMELIALNLGYDLGILSARIFAMLVLMALLTTVLTGPLLTAFGAEKPPR
jgi:Kef-type K+ transport system membrane component KefB